jgi:hypothetical protein
MAKIITAYVHDLLQQVDKGEISFSRMVELINEKANAPSEGDSLNSHCGNTNTTKDNCQVLAKKSNNCKGCEYRVFEPSEGESFRKVYIKSEDDLPRDDANYVCKVAGNDKTYVFEAQIIRDYGLSIDWYLLPVSEPKEEGKGAGEIREILIDFYHEMKNLMLSMLEILM